MYKNMYTFWDKKTRWVLGYCRASLKTGINYVIENCYFKMGHVLIQCLMGILVGVDPAPFWAYLSIKRNLFQF